MEKDIIRIIEAGIRAPSGDNLQPWYFVVKQNTISLMNDLQKDNSMYDPNEIASMISHGTVLENIITAARCAGKDTEVILFPDSANADHVADIRITKSDLLPADATFMNAVYERRTNRGKYRKISLSAEQKSKLFDSVEKANEETEVRIVENVEQIKKLAHLLSLHEKILFSNKELHKGLFGCMRWNKKELQIKKDGLNIKSLGLSLFDELMMRFFMRYWWIARVIKILGIPSIVALKTSATYRASAAIGAIIVKGQTRENLVSVGRVMERMWVEATRLGLGFQPISGMPFLYQGLIANQKDIFSPVQKNDIKESFEKVRNIFGVKEGDHVAVIFRIGQALNPAPHTLRHDTEFFIRRE